MDPGGESRERGQVVIDSRMSQSLHLQRVLPCLDITAKAGREAIVPLGLHKGGLESLQMQGNFLGDGI